MFKALTATFAATTLVFAYLFIVGDDPVLENSIEMEAQYQSELAKLRSESEERIANLKEDLQELQAENSKLTDQLAFAYNKASGAKMASANDDSYQKRGKFNKNGYWNSTSLSKKLKLSAEDQKALLKLMSAKRRAAAGGFYGLTAEQVADKKAEIEEKLRALLGNQYEVYADYSEKEEEYRFVDRFGRSMGNEFQLTDDQKTALVDVMHTEKENEIDGANKNKSEMLRDFAAMSSTELDEYFANLSSKNEELSDKAAGLLSEEQLEAFNKELEHQYNRVRQSANWMTRMREGFMKDQEEGN